MGFLPHSILRLYINLQEELSPLNQNPKEWVRIINFHIPSDFGITTWMGSADSDCPWRDRQGNITTVEINSLQPVRGVLRNSDMITVNLESEYYRTYESGFIDLLNV